MRRKVNYAYNYHQINNMKELHINLMKNIFIEKPYYIEIIKIKMIIN